MGETLNSYSMTGVAAAIAQSLGIQPPRSAGEPLAPVCDMAERLCRGRKAGRALLYNPDAVAMWLYRKYAREFGPVLKHTELSLPLRTVFPPVTPVCFASMYTGAFPEVHGLTKPREKPVVPVDSLFDALAREGRRTAIVAVEGSSMSKIYLGRGIDYFILPYDGEVVEKALELIQRNEHDVLAVYNQEYDDRMHQTQPESPEALQAMRNHIAAFALLAGAVEAHWAGFDTLIGFMTDHGVHLGEDGRGTHGENIAEDLNVMHFYGVKARLFP